MNNLYLLFNRINYRVVFFYVIPATGLLKGLIYNFIEPTAFLSINFFVAILLHLVGPYIFGGAWLVMYSLYKGKIIKGNQNKFNAQNQSLTDSMDMDVMNFDYYSKFTFFAWIVSMFPLFLHLSKI